MTSTKPRIFKHHGEWVVATNQVELEKGQIARVVHISGEGKTPKQAWSKAFPKPWWRRIWS